jgi:flagellar FliL protein
VAVGFAALILIAGLGVYVWERSASYTHAEENGGAVAYTFPLDTFVVNLSGAERAYLRVGIALGLARAPQRKEELPVAMLRDTIVSILSTVKPQEVAAAEGKGKLKGEILRALQERAPQLGIREVYWTEFLVQM